MPRKKRPGPRENRTDLPAVAAQPVRAMTGQRYGARAATTTAQEALPLPDRTTAAMAAGAPGTDLSNAPSGGAPGVPAPGAPPGDLLSQFTAAAQGAQSPAGQSLAAPGDPSIPLTAGMEGGMGPGPEVLAGAPGQPDPSVILWTTALPALGMLASQPDSSPEVRQFYRRVRSQVPPDYYGRT